MTVVSLPHLLPCAALSPDPEDAGLLPTDEDLMLAIQQRDPAALGPLFKRHGDRLRGVILRIVHSATATDDVMQECLVEIWSKAGRYAATKGKALPWIITLCKRRAIDHYRKSTSYTHACDRLENEIRVRPDVTSSSEAEDADLGRVLNQQMNLLPDRQKRAVHLAFMEGMSQREVARATRAPLGTVKTRLELGLQKLRSAFKTMSLMDTLRCG